MPTTPLTIAPSQDTLPVPRHVAIIMDGNGRWASARRLPRVEGHRRGVEAVRRTVEAAIDFNIAVLTIYSFSSENWSRPASEVADLMQLIKLYIRSDLSRLHAQGVKVRVIGSRDGVPTDIARLIDEAEEKTANNTRLTLQVAFNYGARDEILRATRKLASQVADGSLQPDAIDNDLFASCLDTGAVPDPDLLIRTSGEQRLSNFLLWQAAYAEFVFLPVLWPDFSADHLKEAIACYQERNRRFGGRPDASAGEAGL